MRVLVTGAGGFIGRALCRRLLADGHEVAAATRAASPPAEPEGVTWHTGLGPAPGVEWQPVLAGLDAVVHLAGIAHGRPAGPGGEGYRAVNLAGTEHLARAAARCGVAHLLFMSSVKVYGDRGPRDARGRALPVTEALPPAPVGPYAESKLAAERSLTRIAGETSLAVTALEPPLVYGPGVRANFLSLMRAVHRGWPLPLAAVSNRRSLVYVENLVDAVAACLAGIPAPGSFERFLVSDGRDLSTPELIRALARALGVRCRLLAVPPPLLHLAGRVLGRTAQIDRLLDSLFVDTGRLRATGWRPPYDVEAGLAATAAWYLTRQRTGGGR